VASGGSELGHNVGAPVAAGAVAQEEEAATQGLHTQKHGPDQRPGGTSAGRGAGMAGKEESDRLSGREATSGKKTNLLPFLFLRSLI
jgi:hypothetical protein